MSIYGIRGSIPAPANTAGVQNLRQRVEPRPAGTSGAEHQSPVGTARTNGAASPQGAAGATAVPAQPPPGTDPELWSVLSGEERSFFARLGAMGPLTYGRILSGQQQPSAPAMLGGRLDTKV